MSHDGSDDQDKPGKLRSVSRDTVDETLKEISDEILETKNREGQIGEDGPVFVRRLDRRLAKAREGDRPWLRRAVGLLVIVIAFYVGWRMMDRETDEIIRHVKTQYHRPSEPTGRVGGSDTSSTAPTPSVILKPAVESLPDLVPLTGETLNQIADCTKGVNAFRRLALKTETTSPATLESVFFPVLVSEPGVARSTVNLQNVRMRSKNGEEWRLHAAPKTQDGKLHMKFFRVASDGLPEELPFPESLQDLADQPINEAAIARFLSLAATPGQAIEIERHEAWSFPETAGAQVIWSGSQIMDLQVFMKDRFLACARGSKAGEPQVICKCVDRS